MEAGTLASGRPNVIAHERTGTGHEPRSTKHQKLCRVIVRSAATQLRRRSGELMIRRSSRVRSAEACQSDRSRRPETFVGSCALSTRPRAAADGSDGAPLRLSDKANQT